MKVSEILKKNEVTISCEIFPPKQGAQLQNYKAIAAEIAKLKPAYISCTYGATGGTSDYTVEIADAINSYGVPAIAHLTCVSSTREKVHTVISELKERGIENILALRGDIPTNTDFRISITMRLSSSVRSGKPVISASVVHVIRRDIRRLPTWMKT